MNGFPAGLAGFSRVFRWLLAAGAVTLLLYMCSLAALGSVTPPVMAADTRSKLVDRPIYQPWAPTFVPANATLAVAVTPQAGLDGLVMVGPEGGNESGLRGPSNKGGSEFGPLPGPMDGSAGTRAWTTNLQNQQNQPVATELPPALEQPEEEQPQAPTIPSVSTGTARPTSSPEPSRTPKPTEPRKPTNTPKPTKEPKPTDEPRPTEEPKPTDEPKPTKEPKPTEVPKPTDEPTPTVEPSP